MALTAADFKARNPEFAAADDSLVTEKLAEATRRTNATVFGDRFDDAVSMMTAHLLAVSPFGQQARLTSEKGRSTYLDEWERLARQAAGGPHLMNEANAYPFGAWGGWFVP